MREIMRTLAAAGLVAALAALPAAAEPGSGEAPACQADQPADVNGEVEALQRAVMQQMIEAGDDPSEQGIVLNNRGYNYGVPPGVRFDPIVEAPADPQAQ
jgi:hypothetical protein